MLDMPRRIKRSRSAIRIIRRQLEAIQILTRHDRLVSIKMLVVLYRQLPGIQKAANTKPIPQLPPQLQIHIVKHREPPFVKVDITAQNTAPPLLISSDIVGYFEPRPLSPREFNKLLPRLIFHIDRRDHRLMPGKLNS